MDADDLTLIADLEIKGRAFLEAMEAARPALERQRMAAAGTHGTNGLLSETMLYEFESATSERRHTPTGGRRRSDISRRNPGMDPAD